MQLVAEGQSQRKKLLTLTGCHRCAASAGLLERGSFVPSCAEFGGVTVRFASSLGALLSLSKPHHRGQAVFSHLSHSSRRR